MQVIKKIGKLLYDRDARQFMKYSLRHPRDLAFFERPCSKFPPYLKWGREDAAAQASVEIKMLALPAPWAVAGNLPGSVEKKGDFTGNSLGTGRMHGCAGNPAGFQELADAGQIWEIRLAGQRIHIDINDICWHRHFDDPEDTAALHRFIWLYEIVAGNITEGNRQLFYGYVKGAILSWIGEVGSLDREAAHPEVWQPYTVAERIACWSMLLALSSPEPVKDAGITESIVIQMEYLIKNLEYYGERFTGNHLGNDGRGLYIAGMLLGLPRYAHAGKKILLNEFGRVVVDGAFLREGSVHYQFLYTKWFADVYWIARSCYDSVFAKEIARRLEMLLSGCRYFLSRRKDGGWAIPYIGDISPDFTPQWLIGIPWAVQYLLHGDTFKGIPKGKGYHTLFLGDGEGIRKAGHAPYRPCEESMLLCPSDWGHARCSGWEAYAHVNRSLYPNNLTGHFHHDSGGIVLSFEGIPLLIDCGRVNYSLEGKAFYQRSHAGHSLLALDGMDPELEMRSFYPERFLFGYAGAAPRIKCRGDRIKMQVHGGRRMQGICKITRTAVASHGRFVIEDAAWGKGKHMAEIFFHLPDGFTVCERDGEIALAGYGHRFTIRPSLMPGKAGQRRRFHPRLESVQGICSDAYGKEGKCTTVIYKAAAKAPFRIRTEIRHIGKESI